MEDWRYGGFGLYLHWPFCQSKCPYCDFNSHVAASIDQTRWQHAYLAEIDRIGALTQGRVLNSIFFGGGTPSLMEPALVSAILDRISATWTLSNDLEITLEANPGSVEVGRFQGYRSAGVNRVSIGLQALNDADLRALGRLHSVAEGQAALDVAQSTFDRVSFDLIYARQNQTLAAWEVELNQALRRASGHLSVYQLTIEDGTAFGDRLRRGGLKGLPSEDLGADFYDLTQQICGDAGMPAYEVSNHAKTGQESRHNLIYWRAGDYIGIGPGAHGRLTLNGKRIATETPKAPGAWLARVESGNAGESVTDQMNNAERAQEYLIMSLRLTEGASRQRLESMGFSISADRLAHLQQIDMINADAQTIRATAQGRKVLNAVISALAGQ